MDFPAKPLFALLFCAYLTGCATKAPKPKTVAPLPDATASSRQPDLIPVIAALHDQMNTWQDTPYQWGGTKARWHRLLRFCLAHAARPV